ncbi:hypothetical protein HPB47_027648, partial [Ixodes persulcatus]
GTDKDLQRTRSMEVKFDKIHWLPWVFVCTLTFSVMILYAWSVLIGDVPVFLPYVSDAGGNAPQSALFGVALMVAAFSGIPPFLVRFLSVRAVDSPRKKLIAGLNYLALVFAVLAWLGIVMVGISPMNHLRRDGTWLLPILIPHLAGASMVFVFSVAYFVVQISFAWMLGPQYRRPMVGYARMASTAACIAGSVAMAVFAPFETPDDFKPNATHGSVYRGNTAWSAFGEWILIIGLMCNILTLVPDMKGVRVTLHIENLADVSEKEVPNEMLKL